MKWLPRQIRNPVDETEDDGGTYLVDVEGTVDVMTRTQIRKAKAAGKAVEPFDEASRKLPELGGGKVQHRAPEPPEPVKKPSKPAKRAAAGRSGRGFTHAEQKRGAPLGGKARWQGLSKAQRAEAARKAVMARWANVRKRRKTR